MVSFWQRKKIKRRVGWGVLIGYGGWNEPTSNFEILFFQKRIQTIVFFRIFLALIWYAYCPYRWKNMNFQNFQTKILKNFWGKTRLLFCTLAAHDIFSKFVYSICANTTALLIWMPGNTFQTHYGHFRQNVPSKNHSIFRQIFFKNNQSAELKAPKS